MWQGSASRNSVGLRCVSVSISVCAGEILPLLLHSCAPTVQALSYGANLSNYINLSHTHLWLPQHLPPPELS